MKPTFEWNKILRLSSPHQAISIYACSMLHSGSHPNKFTFTFLLKHCLRLPSILPLLHAHITLLGFHRDPFLRSALIAAYSRRRDLPVVLALFRQEPAHHDPVLCTALLSAFARCGIPDAARQVFDEMPERNPVSWAALLSAYSHGGRDAEALGVFRRMLLDGIPLTEAASVSVLSSAARVSALEHGQRVHHFIILSSGGVSVASTVIGTALLEMYAKCGLVEDAAKVFDRMHNRDQPAWAAMISAFAAHGRGADALRLFDEMLELGFKPDNVTLLAVLHACSHAGLVAVAKEHFDRMVRVYGITPALEHYGCMVDALGRAGMVEDAWETVRAMPVEPDKYVLKSLLRACCEHGFEQQAEWAARKLMAMDAGGAASYVLLSNAYAGLGRWEEVERVRKLMRARGVPKPSGSSAVD